ncbi:MAG: DUF1570 domain-containing protein [Planctomycetales bacterium]
MIGLLCLPGCHLLNRETTHLPNRHQLKSEQLLVLSDFKLSNDHPLIKDLSLLRQQVSETLQLPLTGNPVTVYLFRDEMEYHKYLQAAHPGLPTRRAYFIQNSKGLAVYTYWGDRIQEDLRHEYTHGLLHSALTNVPLWIDEGLAEYFEMSGPQPGTINPEYADRLATAVKNGWQPDMERLESLEKVEQMQRGDYREAWGWVHFMLHHSDDTRQVLLSYVSDLKTSKNPEVLSKRLSRDTPEFKTRFLAYVGTLRSQRLQAASTLKTKAALTAELNK